MLRCCRPPPARSTQGSRRRLLRSAGEPAPPCSIAAVCHPPPVMRPAEAGPPAAWRPVLVATTVVEDKEAVPGSKKVGCTEQPVFPLLLPSLVALSCRWKKLGPPPSICDAAWGGDARGGAAGRESHVGVLSTAPCPPCGLDTSDCTATLAIFVFLIPPIPMHRAYTCTPDVTLAMSRSIMCLVISSYW